MMSIKSFAAYRLYLWIRHDVSLWIRFCMAVSHDPLLSHEIFLEYNLDFINTMNK